MDGSPVKNYQQIRDETRANIRARASRLRIDQLNLLNEQTATSLAATVIVGGILILTLHDKGAPGAPLAYWYIAVLALAIGRYNVLSVYRKNEITEENVDRWYKVFAISVALSGGIWGYAIFLAVPSDYLQVVITLLMLAGMASGSALVYAASIRIIAAFNLPMAVIIALSASRSPELSNLVILVALYFGIVLVAGARTCRAVAESLSLRQENYELIENLLSEKQQIVELNEKLESRVDERTEQLLQSNERLREEIGEKAHIQKSLAHSEELYRSLYHSNPSLFITIDTGGEITSINDYGLQFLGFSREALLGQPVSVLCDNDTASEIARHLELCIADNTDVQRWKSKFTLQSGEQIYVRIVARAAPDTDGNVLVHLVCEDITEAQELERSLSFQASHDPLTALYNRREFEARLERVIRDRRQTDVEYAVCFLDIDQFKLVNDTCGHVAGDELLRRISQTLSQHIRDGDTLARLGGDEFAILMAHTSLDDAHNLIERLRAAVEKFTFRWQSKKFQLSASFGITEITNDSGTPADVLRNADTACYVAKDSGRNRIRVHQDDDLVIAQRKSEIDWVTRIDAALSDDRLRISLQPIVAAARRQEQLAHWEVLLRMLSEDGEIIAPAVFLPSAERFGLMPRIDRWVVNSTIAYLERHHAYADPVCYSINLSSTSLGDEKFLTFIKGCIRESSASAQQVCFEITETSAIANLANVSEFITELKSVGFRFSLDDFGTGMASFDYLRALPVNYLKIDGSFITDINDNPISLAMVRAVNDIAHLMEMETIAEFVENDDIAATLRALGIDYLQGFGIGKPALVDEELQKASGADIKHSLEFAK